MSRVPILSEELIEEICERIAEGQSVRDICKDPEMPDRSTLRNWHIGSKPIHRHWQKCYAIAREEQADLYADSIIEIADLADEDNANAIKVRVDARKWVASKLRPKVYGTSTSIELNGSVQLSAEADLSRYSDEELKLIADIQRRAANRSTLGAGNGSGSRPRQIAESVGDRSGDEVLEEDCTQVTEATEG